MHSFLRSGNRVEIRVRSVVPALLLVLFPVVAWLFVQHLIGKGTSSGRIWTAVAVAGVIELGLVYMQFFSKALKLLVIDFGNRTVRRVLRNRSREVSSFDGLDVRVRRSGGVRKRHFGLFVTLTVENAGDSREWELFRADEYRDVVPIVRDLHGLDVEGLLTLDAEGHFVATTELKLLKPRAISLVIFSLLAFFLVGWAATDSRLGEMLSLEKRYLLAGVLATLAVLAVMWLIYAIYYAWMIKSDPRPRLATFFMMPAPRLNRSTAQVERSEAWRDGVVERSDAALDQLSVDAQRALFEQILELTADDVLERSALGPIADAVVPPTLQRIQFDDEQLELLHQVINRRRSS